jgi:hypothetical protein
MSSLRNKIRLRGAMAALLVSLFISALSPIAYAQGLAISSATPIPTPESEENPFLKLMRPPRKPIPLRWKIAIVLGALAVGSTSLWFALRVWRKSNLFDREYHFPRLATAALRLGAVRSGGHMATSTFRDRAGPGTTN